MSAVHILIVDDDPMLRETLHDILTLRGHVVATADCGAAAHRVTEEAAPAVAIVDLRLPDTDGLRLCEELRSLRPTLQTVMLTGNATVESAAAAVRSATVDYLVKPVDPDTLCGVLDRAADRWRSAQIESELRRDHKRFRLLLDSLSEIVTVVSSTGDIRYESGAVASVLGLDPNDRIGSAFLEWVHPEDLETARQLFHRNGDPPGETRIEVRVRAHDATWRAVEFATNRAFSKPGLEGTLLTGRDVTEKRRLEADLRQSQKMEAIGQLTGGIAHEINNVLTVVLANGQSVVDDLPMGNADTLRDLEDLMDAARHGATLVGKLLGFSRRQRLTKHTIDVRETVAQALRMLRRMVPATISLRYEPAADPCYAVADDGAIDQVIMNLVTNARDAMPDGGSVTVQTGITTFDDEFCANHSGAQPGRYVHISVADTGCGIDATDLDHVFEPFFTTKPPNGGTGLGMSMVYGLMKQHQGYSHIDSAVGRGTTVHLYLPSTTPTPEMTAPAPPPARSRGGGQGTVLLVEDQPALRRTGQRILLRQGYTVLTAADGGEALDLLREHREIDLVVADVVMPNMGGKALAAELATWDRAPTILFTSGYSADDLRKGDLLDPTFRLLRKPWTVDELVESVRATLAAVREEPA